VNDIAIDLPRPRNLHTLADTKFAELCNMLRREFN
jgi:hypothetical protein